MGRKPKTTHCSIEGCDRFERCRGLCIGHYARLRKGKDLHGMIRVGHGLSKLPEYRTWHSMIQRCHNPNSTGYKDYGGRGITVFQPWKDSFVNFYRDVGQKTDSKSTIDRINVNGNYEPGNVRWANLSTQMHNQRIDRDAISSYHGVWKKTDKFRTLPYTADAMLDGIKYRLGMYETQEEAAIAYDCAVIQLRGNLAQTNIL